MDERSQLLIKKFLRTFARRAEIFNLAFLPPLPPEWDGRKCPHKWQSISRIATMIYAKVRTAPRGSFTLFKDLHRRRDIWRQKVCERESGRGGVAYSILHALLKPQCRQLKRILLPPSRLLPSHLSGAAIDRARRRALGGSFHIRCVKRTSSLRSKSTH